MQSGALLLVAALAAGCSDEQNDPTSPAPQHSQTAAAPSPLVNVAFGSGSLSLFPYTSENFSGTPQDPINIVFPNQDPRSVRAALLFLNGNRTAFGLPGGAPFDCTWNDAVGANQVAYTQHGWTGSAIQLQCGEFGPIRFHIRLFPAGSWTIGNVHFEVLIPGTDQHQVLSWEVAEQLVMVDMLRTGVLDGSFPLMPSAQITAAPTFREINPFVYASLPPELVGLIGGPGIANDGRATIFNMTTAVEGGRLVAKNEFVIDYDQTVPNPVCGGYLYVNGPLKVSQRVVMTPSGNLVSQIHAGGMLDITPVYPAGESFKARVNEQLTNVLTDNTSLVSTIQLRIMIPPTAPFRGTLHATVRVGPGGTHSSFEVRCNS